MGGIREFPDRIARIFHTANDTIPQRFCHPRQACYLRMR
jgi:hypothetical protein